MIYHISVKEVSRGSISIEASSQEEAEQLAEQAYYNGEINWKESDMEITQIYSSRKIERGRHTTRQVELFPLSEDAHCGYIADTPGFSTFDTQRYAIIRKDALEDCFAEFAEYKENCRFHDCSHTCEKGCAVLDAVAEGIIPKSRHESYCDMYEEAKQIKEWEL